MREKIFALTSVLTLLLTSGIAVAWGGPDGTIDTYFLADGGLPVFESGLQLSDGDYVIEKVWTLEGTVGVKENIDIDDGWFGTSANIDKQIMVDPGQFFCMEFDAHVEKTAGWDGTGEVYRRADLEDGTVSIVDVSTTLFGDALFIDNIEYKDMVNVYESVGLNTFASCDPVEMPDPLEPPVCGWC